MHASAETFRNVTFVAGMGSSFRLSNLPYTLSYECFHELGKRLPRLCAKKARARSVREPITIFMKETGDVIVLGAGVIGLTTAYFLGRAGVKVHVLDRGEIGKESSWAGAGILPPSNAATAREPFDCLRALSGEWMAKLSAEIRERTGHDNGYWPCGGIEIHSSHLKADPLEWFGAGSEVVEITADQVRSLEPDLAEDVGPGRWIPGMAQIRNPWHMRGLEAACSATGNVSLHPHAEVQAWIVNEGQVQGVRAANGEWQGDHFLVAGGAWSDSLLRELGTMLGVFPVRGQIALIHPDRPLLRTIVTQGASYLVPRKEGVVLVGSTEEDVGFDRRTTAMGIAGLLAWAIRLVPELGRAAVEKCWAGLRPASPDGLPFLGPVPGHANVFVATGHFRAGVQLSAGTGLLLKQWILGEPRAINTDAFQLNGRSNFANRTK